jgi:hypothetical protein
MATPSWIKNHLTLTPKIPPTVPFLQSVTFLFSLLELAKGSLIKEASSARLHDRARRGTHSPGMQVGAEVGHWNVKSQTIMIPSQSRLASGLR